MIALCPNPYRDIELALTLEIRDLLRKNGYETVIFPVFAGKDSNVIPPEVEICNTLDEFLSHITLAVVIGGDGTILSVSHEIFENEIPILGINLGTKGFMAPVEPDEIYLVLKAARGEYRLSRRMMLDVFLERNGIAEYKGSALNDAVIHGYGDTIKIDAFSDDVAVTSFAGDGIILSTPTGSTGYSMSAGGPITEPEAECIVVSPICAHSLNARTFVLSHKRKVSVYVGRLNEKRAYLSIDGNLNIDLQNEDAVIVRESGCRILMADPGEKSFYQTVFMKLE